MSKAADALRALRIFNGHDVARLAAAAGVGEGLYLSYRPQDTGRGSHSAAWQVIHTDGSPTDSKGHWADYGWKTFTVYGRAGKQPQLEAAKAWTAEQFGITDWAPVPGIRDDKFPAEVAAWVKAQVKAAAQRTPEAT